MFQRELAKINGPVTDFIRKHITTGSPIGITAETYFELRRQVSGHFKIHPSAVVVVGSMKLGFSLKAKSKLKGVAGSRFMPFDGDSDVDVAVVSSQLFDLYWDELFKISGPRAQNVYENEARKSVVIGLFSGWIAPSELPSSPRSERAEAWRKFFDQLTLARVCGLRPIKGRLYRDWSRLEAYQALMVQECRAALSEGKPEK